MPLLRIKDGAAVDGGMVPVSAFRSAGQNY
jgi:hypothetical protein